MTKDQVILALQQTADLLEISGAGTFEVLAYRNGARSLEEWSGDLPRAVADSTLTEIAGIGKGLAKTIGELVEHGRATSIDRLRASVPPRLPELLALPGLGPKRVRALWTSLGVSDVDELARAAGGGRLRGLRGFGEATEQRILRAIDRQRDAQSPSSSSTAKRRRETTRAEFPLLATEAATATDRDHGGDAAREGLTGKGRLFAGTSGYAFKEWKGSFYPEDLPAADFLSFYARRFPTVEINNTFYRFPATKVLEQWASRTPEGFLLALKANQRITHSLRLKDAGEVARSFVERCSVLGDRLGPILFQLPPNLRRDDDRLAVFLAALPPSQRYAIELRHESWFDEAVLQLLQDHQVALVVADDPTRPSPRGITASFAYVRLRQDEYDSKALRGWDTWFAKLRDETRDVFVYLKHDEDGTSPEATLRRWLPSAAPRRRQAASARSRRAPRQGRRQRRA